MILFNPLLGDKRFHTFSKGNSLKQNIIAWLQFTLAYFEAAGQQFNQYAMRTSLKTIEIFEKKNWSYLHIPDYFPQIDYYTRNVSEVRFKKMKTTRRRIDSETANDELEKIPFGWA